jgi:photosystem II stability/assembly factor-like uncharacterized protein
MDAVIALDDRLVVAHDVADAARATHHLTDTGAECVAAAGEHLLVGTFDDGLWRATGDGAFERVAPDALPDRVPSLAVAPGAPDTVYLGAEPSAVHRSDDGGRSWAACAPLTDLPSADGWSFPPRPDTHHVRTMAVHPTDPDRLAVGVEAGALVRSADGGATWTERPPGARIDNHALATHPAAPERLYAAAGDGYAESRDGGETWQHPTEGLGHGYVWGLAVDPGDPDRVYVSAAHGAYAAHRPETADAHVYRREGDRWQRFDGASLGAGLPTGEGVCRAVLAAPADGELLAATDRGLFRSTDAGASFERALDAEGWGVPNAVGFTR